MDKHIELNEKFTEILDEFVLSIKNDPELTSGIKWLNDEAHNRGITFYEMAFKALYDPEVRKWFNSTQ